MKKAVYYSTDSTKLRHSLTSATQPIKPTVAPVSGDSVAVGSGPPRYKGSFRFRPTVLPGEVP